MLKASTTTSQYLAPVLPSNQLLLPNVSTHCCTYVTAPSLCYLTWLPHTATSHGYLTLLPHTATSHGYLTRLTHTATLTAATSCCTHRHPQRGATPRNGLKNNRATRPKQNGRDNTLAATTGLVEQERSKRSMMRIVRATQSIIMCNTCQARCE